MTRHRPDERPGSLAPRNGMFRKYRNHRRICEQNALFYASFPNLPRMDAIFSRIRRISIAGAQEY
ncbi:hypothetical protein SD70_14500 [Gordoniibacillus kamchatkensis]|uniref:Uncharacterized protein n=1 Tax=Gordoniibacillus kamchatkensis TaxID=1590651 RepID=A0ABR5AHB8_9BACL|nr:hypothetical protein SD70_14500 [Paenibacillus sp. VKM B-2647]